MYDENDRHMYIVLDPINHSYNPAKGVKSNKFNQSNNFYPLVFRKALRSILINGQNDEMENIMEFESIDE